jgi:DNA integrity scanning protein DisA with diadenylate cyclase activity
MVRRIASEIVGYLVELGTDGRLLSLQLDELVAGVEADRVLVVRDYQPGTSRKSVRNLEHALADLDALSATDLLDLGAVAKAIGFTPADDLLDSAVSPRGWRLARVPGSRDRQRAPRRPLRRAAEAAAASIDDLQAVGVSAVPRAACEGCRGWPSPASSSATSDPQRGTARDAVEPCEDGAMALLNPGPPRHDVPAPRG